MPIKERLKCDLILTLDSKKKHLLCSGSVVVVVVVVVVHCSKCSHCL